MLKKLVLFDIDGTLLRVGNINRQSLIDALMAVYGTEGSARSHNFSGKMDSVIIYEVLRHAGLEEQRIEERFDEVKQTYIELFRKQSRPEDIELLKGVPPLLEELSRQNGILLGLLTGNFEGSGRHKLKLPAIDHYFPFGAFADDAYDRNDLPAIAVEKAFALTGKRFHPDEVVIIGDTEHDIRCARTIRARSVAVATGNYSARQLNAHRPDVLFEDFGNTKEVIDRIVNF
ncbi:hydrolase [Prosthecochloris sp. GSB1]|uniref:HAD family hydrolase n=1 Tax=Prosthecochloris sp. GSB1 TaxID=281093 RepID=UPI000B8C798A|nr:HAD hydrolase-like protein [Prosthecochloris sp. GSB1]ASQ91101.1 hydrolase [Prosthecochloris sp. GSB1]